MLAAVIGAVVCAAAVVWFLVRLSEHLRKPFAVGNSIVIALYCVVLAVALSFLFENGTVLYFRLAENPERVEVTVSDVESKRPIAFDGRGHGYIGEEKTEVHFREYPGLPFVFSGQQNWTVGDKVKVDLYIAHDEIVAYDLADGTG